MPFDIKRVYWICDVPVGGIRGRRAYKILYEYIGALTCFFNLIFMVERKNKNFT
ncbi:MAG: WxcM-like domain-containing protein [Candidatus Helarchaeota archaeon]